MARHKVLVLHLLVTSDAFSDAPSAHGENSWCTLRADAPEISTKIICLTLYAHFSRTRKKVDLKNHYYRINLF